MSPSGGGDPRPARGRRAEALAARALESQGLTVLHRNWRRPEGEIDLVARTPDGVVVFVEVRSRTGALWGHPLESIGPRKRRQIVGAARLFLTEADAPATGYRFDVVGVTFSSNPDGEPLVEHIPDAFQI